MIKKYLTLASVAFLAVFVSGCSLYGTSTDGGDPSVKKSSVLKSLDGGKTWETKTDDGINLDAADVLSMSIDPQNGQKVFIGTLKNGILVTENGGETWSALVFPAEKVYGLLNDYSDSSTIYASGVWQGRGKIFKSSNSGVDWDEIYTSPSNGPLIIAMANNKNNPNVLFAATSDKQIIKSIDSGVSWKNIHSAPTPILRIAIDSGNSNIVYLSGQDGKITISRDGGETFGLSSDGIKGSTDFVAADPANAGWVYAAGKAGIWRSKDAGEKWEQLKTLGDPNSFPVRSLAINPYNPNEIVYGAGQAVYKSVDGGTNWIPFQLQSGKNISIIRYDSTSPDIMYLGMRKK